METKQRISHFYRHWYFLFAAALTTPFLAAQSITVLSPNGSEEIAAGSLYLIE